jgi:fused signal recognition particle receptor
MSSSDPSNPKPGLFARLKAGLSRSSSSLTSGLGGLFTKKRLDAETIAELEDALIRADLGASVAASLAGQISKDRFDKEISEEEIRAILAQEIAKLLTPCAKAFAVEPGKKPFVVLVAGVNGTGKTTTIGKLAALLSSQGHKIVLAAGDTFRAAAIEQLQIWGKRAGAKVVAKESGADSAGLAYDALAQAKEDGADVLLIDTAGRLQNKSGLMAELEKIVRVLRKLDEEAPHAAILVLDATTGQNALSQVEAFKKVIPLTGLIMTKLDGTAKGGILVALAHKFGLPIHFVGVGEGIEDLQEFDAQSFAQALAGN